MTPSLILRWNSTGLASGGGVSAASVESVANDAAEVATPNAPPMNWRRFNVSCLLKCRLLSLSAWGYLSGGETRCQGDFMRNCSWQPKDLLHVGVAGLKIQMDWLSNDG